MPRLNMNMISDNALSRWSSVLQWVAILSGILAVISAIGMFYVNREIDHRKDKKISQLQEQTRPRTTAEKLDKFFELVDPKSLSRLKTGATKVTLVLTQPQHEEIKRIAAEDSLKRITVSQPTNPRGVLMELNANGVSVTVVLSVDPSVFTSPA